MADFIYFGRLGDITGKLSERETLPAEIRTVSELRDWMEQRYETEGTFHDRTVRIAVNNSFVTNDHALTDADEIAFMPPVGGG